MPLLPERRCSASAERSGSLARSAVFTNRCLPLSTLVTTIAARRAARSAFSAVRLSSFMASQRTDDLVHLLHKHPNRAAARQAHLPSGFVGDAEVKHFWLAVFDHVQRFRDDGAFDTAPGHRAEE